MRKALIAAVIAACLGLGASFLQAGPLGVIVTSTVLAALVILVLRAMLVQEPAREAVKYKHKGSDDGARAFRTYRRIAGDLGWARVSRRHYDHGIRPLLVRLLASLLAERHGIDLAREPDRARRLVGGDLWPLIDPAQPLSNNDRAPGVDRATLSRIVERLEEL
jgi:hypothetical protein